MAESSTLGLSKFVTLWPVVPIRGSKYLNNFIHLIDLIRAGEQRAKGVEFCHDASKCEDINWGVVVRGPEQEFWSAIPEWGIGYHLVET
jgi:hypothetical protein